MSATWPAPSAEALVQPEAAGEVFNIGSGAGPQRQARSRSSIARAMDRNDLEPEIVGKARVGDIRHCFCDGTQGGGDARLPAPKRTSTRASPSSPNGSPSRKRDDRVDEARAELEAQGAGGMSGAATAARS